MSQATVARRYALALYNEAQSQNRVSDVDADVVALQTSLRDSHELSLFFKSPIINRDKKQRILTRLLEGKMSETTINFVHLVVQKGRDTVMTDILSAYQALRDTQIGIVSAEVKMAYKPSLEEVATLQTKLEGMTGKQVRLQISEDTTLIGGAVVKIGDTMYDGSVRRQLVVLKDRLMHGSHLNN